jgi:hypothetical protein
MLSERSLPRLARGEHGFSLMETLIAMLSAVVITGALFVVLEVALHQTSRISDVAQATQLGRTALTHVVDELHSACLAPQFTPVQAGSTENKLIFITSYGSQAELPTAHKEKIELSGGYLIDTSYPSTGGTWPKFTFAPESSPTVTRIGEKISQTESEETKAKVPVFQYYKYASKVSSGGENNPLGALEAVSPGAGLSATSAETVASVAVSFMAGSPSGNVALHRSTDVSNQVTFAFSAPDPEATIKDAPCQ